MFSTLSLEAFTKDLRENQKINNRKFVWNLTEILIGEATFALTTFSTVGHTREL